MNVLVCPTSFKGTLSASEAAAAMAAGVKEAWPGARTILLPIADGGEGTLEVLLSSGGRRFTETVHGPTGEEVRADWGLLPDGTAVVEAAEACGLVRFPDTRTSLLEANTYGVGELIRAALGARPKRLVVTLGGSATNDVGAGAISALGAKFLDARGRELPPKMSALVAVKSVHLSKLLLPEVPITAACDVDNPLVGPAGATRTFGPQKGASAEEIETLEQVATRVASAYERAIGRAVATIPGSGSAGGLGAVLLGVLGGRFEFGIDLVMEAARFDDVVGGADLILTGEGRLDSQSLRGKAIAGVLGRSRGKPVVVVAGDVRLEEEEWRRWGVTRAYSAAELARQDASSPAAVLERATAQALLHYRRT